jgi:hypothetical protein
MPTLTDEMKTFIVMGLARFETPTRVALAVRSAFGVEVTRHQVHRYDPKCSEPPAPRWRELHAATRAAFLAEIAEIGISHKVVRLKMLDEITNYALENHYRDDVAAYLKQAAKECGGIYERRAPLPPSSPDREEASDNLERRCPPAPPEQSQSGERAHEQRQCRGEWNGAGRVHDDVVEADARARGDTAARAGPHADRNGEAEERDVRPARERAEIDALQRGTADIQRRTGRGCEDAGECRRIEVLIPSGDGHAPEVEVAARERKRNLLSTIAAMDHPNGIAAGRAAIDGKV